jgi:O-antigen/teichoic acid export membrane protein
LSGPRSYGRGAAVLSVGIGVTGLVTYTYFSLASHSLADDEYGRISLLWSAVFVVVSVLYRPVEQLLSRTIAERSADAHVLRVAATIQAALGAVFVAGALALRGPIEDGLFGGSSTLYWIFVATVVAYAASYFARGFLAGHHRFGAYGSLVLLEATSRCLFAVAVATGISEGQDAVALGMVAAPVVSLAVVPFVTRRILFIDAMNNVSRVEPEAEFTLAHGTGFAAAVVLVMLSEQTFLNAGPLVVKATESGAEGAALAGFTFNVLLIARAPLQLFQSIQAPILPHLTKMHTAAEADEFRQTVRVTLIAIGGFAATVALALLAIGPWAMDVLFGSDVEYGRFGLCLIAVGMGLYLAAATLSQAALARGKTKEAAACWLTSATAFVGFLLIPGWDDRVVQVEVGYAAGAAVLCALLYWVYRRSQ